MQISIMPEYKKIKNPIQNSNSALQERTLKHMALLLNLKAKGALDTPFADI